MNLLAIETSGPVLSVAVKKGTRAARETVLKGYFRHAENLLPLIDKLLRKEKLGIRNIDAFLIGRGPGSFTGLRVGFATLKGLIATRKKPCYGALSTDLIAGGLPVCEKKTLHVCLNAKRDKLYVRSYHCRKKAWAPRKATTVLSFEEFSGIITGDSVLAGDGLSADKNGILTRSGKKPIGVPEKSWHPKASTLITLFEKKDPMLRPLVKPKEFLPVYIRSSEAEERLRHPKK